jgi:hypothetical protein
MYTIFRALIGILLLSFVVSLGSCAGWLITGLSEPLSAYGASTEARATMNRFFAAFVVSIAVCFIVGMLLWLIALWADKR